MFCFTCIYVYTYIYTVCMHDKFLQQWIRFDNGACTLKVHPISGSLGVTMGAGLEKLSWNLWTIGRQGWKDAQVRLVTADYDPTLVNQHNVKGANNRPLSARLWIYRSTCLAASKSIASCISYETGCITWITTIRISSTALKLFNSHWLEM